MGLQQGIVLPPIIIPPPDGEAVNPGWGTGIEDWVSVNKNKGIDQLIEAYIAETQATYEQIMESDVFTVSVYDAFSYLAQTPQYIKDALLQWSYFDSIAGNGDTGADAVSWEWTGQSYNDYNNTFSSSNFSSMRGMAHYLYGKGAKMNMPLKDIGLEVEASDVPIQGKTLDQYLKNQTFVGTRNIEVNKFAYDVFQSDFDKGLLLGNISLKLTGTVTREADGDWKFDGVIKGYDDKYDFNASFHRPELAEWATWIGSLTPGTEYNIGLPGQIDVHWSSDDE